MPITCTIWLWTVFDPYPCTTPSRLCLSLCVCANNAFCPSLSFLGASGIPSQQKDMQIVESIIGPEYMSLIIGYSFIYRKGLFRDGLFKCEGRAEEGTTAEEVMQQGMCGCLDLDMEKARFTFMTLPYETKL